MRRAAVIGGGHNGLVAAFFLRQSGRFTVDVFEALSSLGGACATREFHPGFRNSAAAYAVGLLSPRVVQALELTRRGVTVVPWSGTLVPSEEGGEGFEASWEDASITAASLRRSGDEEAWARYHAMLAPLAPLLLELLNAPPPSLRDWRRMLPAVAAAARLSAAQRRDLFELLTRPVGELLDAHFRGDAVKGMLAFDAAIGSQASLYAGGGSGLSLLNRSLGGTGDPRVGPAGHALGGMGSITQAMARACEDAGVALHVDAPVDRVVVAERAAVGVEVRGTSHRYDVVVGAVHPSALVLELTDERAFAADPGYVPAMRRFRSNSGSLRMSLALSEPPQWRMLDGAAAQRRAERCSVLIGPSLPYYERAYHDSMSVGFSRRPVVELQVPSFMDSSLAPAGKHVATLFCQHFRYSRDTSDAMRDEQASAVIDAVAALTTNDFRRSILGRSVLTPRDLEAQFRLVRGDVSHGCMTLSQLLAARPVLGWARYATPVKNLFLSSAGTHPGGGVTGLPGMLAAEAVLRSR